jgi:hypothetical protein
MALGETLGGTFVGSVPLFRSKKSRLRSRSALQLRARSCTMSEGTSAQLGAQRALTRGHWARHG